VPSASAGSGFFVCADELVGAQPALVLYSSRPSYSRALGSGVLCLAPPLQRSPALATGGTQGACDGSIDFDMNAWIASGADPALQAGSTVYAQAWGRDPLDPFGCVLSDALAILVGP
jgi:hypothetical protein